MKPGLPSAAFAALLLAAFCVSLAYGIALPVLPFLLELRLGAGADVAWHTGLLTGTYTLALFLFAPLWGRLSDRRRRRRGVILAGMAGFTLSLLLFAFVDSLVALYLGRFLTGGFSAAVIPVSMALIGDWAPDENWRARRFAWLSIAGVGGFLVGPMVGGFVAGMWREGMPLSGAPFLTSAAAGAVGTLALWLTLPRRAPTSKAAAGPIAHMGTRLVPRLLALSGIVAAGIGIFEVALALRAQQALGLSPAEIGLMFTECSLVMVVAQALVFNPWFPARATRWLLAPAFAALAGALALAPWVETPARLYLAVGLVAAGAGILSPILALWVSLAAGKAQGGALGRQTAAASLGQAIGSALGGLLFGLEPRLPGLPFLAAAAAALVGLALALRLPGQLAPLAARAAGADAPQR